MNARTYVAASILAALVVAGASLALLYGPGERTEPFAEETPIPSRVPPPGHKHYWSEAYQFSLFYPERFLAQEIPEEGRGITVVFQDPSTLEGFQVFVIPYFEETISDERFRLDVPSGVRENERKSELDGREAVEFESENAALGKTLELWSIEYGYLYEITTMLEARDLMNAITKSWRFF